jgi:hypothetical protein
MPRELRRKARLDQIFIGPISSGPMFASADR